MVNEVQSVSLPIDAGDERNGVAWGICGAGVEVNNQLLLVPHPHSPSSSPP